MHALHVTLMCLFGLNTIMNARSAVTEKERSGRAVAVIGLVGSIGLCLWVWMVGWR